MKVLISGLSGSGKTTLSKSLSISLGIPIISENYGQITDARNNFVRHRSSDPDTSRESYAIVLESYLKWMGQRRNVYCVDYSVGQRHLERRERGQAQDEFHGKLAALRYPEWEVVHDDGSMVAIGAPGRV